jgi:ribosomal protein S16
MEGIRYVYDEQNRKVAVQIDLEKYGELWEDIYDAIVAESRKEEESEPFDQVVSELRDSGKYNDLSSKDKEER